MRLHGLTLAAFGPFAAAQHIDFDRLAGAGLFLLHGPTGAGKTAVLDAICYALYGSVPGPRRTQLRALRSHHAEPGTPTEVVLDLTVSGRRLRVTRRPEQSRPKKRGSGYTVDKPVTLLAERTPGGSWRALSRSHQEIGEELGRLIGMNREQFCQVVLLPQGDFARFLRADAEDRAALLGRLFDTGRFAAAERHLAERRVDALARVRTGDEHILALLHRVEQAAGPGLPPPAEHAPGEPELAGEALAFAAWARCAAREEAELAATLLAAAEAAHRDAQRELAETTERARLQREHADAAARGRRLAAGAERAAADRARLDRARAAETVGPALELCEDAAEAQDRARAAERTARAALPAGVRDAGAEELTGREAAVRRELGALAAARRAEERAERVTAELARLRALERADREALDAVERRTEEAAAVLDALRRRLEQARSAAATAGGLAAELTEAEHRLGAARRAAELAARLDGLEAGLLAARERAATAYEKWLELKERRLRGFAAELAATLEPGRPCAVCGSPDHPRPAAAAGHTARADEEAALAGHRSAEEHRQECERRLAAARAEHAALLDRAAGRPEAELAAEAEEVRKRHADARAAAADAEAARGELATAEAAHRELAAEGQRLRERLAAHASRGAALDAERAALHAEIRHAPAVPEPPGDAGPGPDGTAARSDGGGPPAAGTGVAARAAALEEYADALAAAADAARATARAAELRKDADARAADAAYRAGFAGPEEATAARLPPAEQRELARLLAEREAEQAAVTAVLTDLRTADAAAAPPADAAAAADAAEAALRRLRRAAAADCAAGDRLGELERLSAALAEAVRRQAPVRAESLRVSRLAQLAAGTAAENTYRMRLETYVLTARLEQIAAAADTRLHRMSVGRYVLTHSDARSGRGRSGLGLRVLDSWTGSDRDTATLSGGESFFVSLALALGLADVVAEESGGRRLDTLFVDEGFGSLDEHSLDEVLDVLDALREQDRTVGIVSHVPELRARVPVRLEIVKNRTGSAVRHHTAPLAG